MISNDLDDLCPGRGNDRTGSEVGMTVNLLINAVGVCAVIKLM